MKKKKKKKKKKKQAASGCWHYSKSRANIKWTLEKIWAAGACQRPDIYIWALASVLALSATNNN